MTFVEKMASAFQDELSKIAAAPPTTAGKMLVPGLIAGSLGTLALQRAHKDWRMGRAMRMQNQQGY